MGIRYRHEGVDIDLDDTVLKIFANHRQMQARAPEAGGQLFARIHDTSLEVCHATTPSTRDKQSRFSFWPSRSREQNDIDKLFAKSLHFVGDWHTHPEDSPSPSSCDIAKLSEIFRKSQHELPWMLLVVVGRDARASGIWVGAVRNDGEFVRLNPK